MGMSAASGAKGGSGRRGRRGRRHGALAAINMTPFIDVMLVLLIIFMVAAPLIATGVPLDLPQTGAKPINVDQKPLTIAIDSKGQIFSLYAKRNDSVTYQYQIISLNMPYSAADNAGLQKLLTDKGAQGALA